eukprot:scaffold26603_cov17-Tisochrysis_lutea.AAC.1
MGQRVDSAAACWQGPGPKMAWWWGLDWVRDACRKKVQTRRRALEFQMEQGGEQASLLNQRKHRAKDSNCKVVQCSALELMSLSLNRWCSDRWKFLHAVVRCNRRSLHFLLRSSCAQLVPHRLCLCNRNSRKPLPTSAPCGHQHPGVKGRKTAHCVQPRALWNGSSTGELARLHLANVLLHGSPTWWSSSCNIARLRTGVVGVVDIGPPWHSWIPVPFAVWWR